MGKSFIHLGLEYIRVTQNKCMSKYVPHFHGAAQELSDIVKNFQMYIRTSFVTKFTIILF